MRRAWAGVMFDLDGTLADTVGLILASFRHTMEVHRGKALSDDHWLATIGTPLHNQMSTFARDERELRAMVETYAEYQRARHDQVVKPFPGARDVLDLLRERGSGLAVVTSKRDRIARRTLEVCGLLDVVDVLVTADDVGRGKPDPEPVLLALEGLGLQSRGREVVFVGDSPFDLRAGLAGGTRTAAALWGPIARAVLEAERPDFYLASLWETLELRPEIG